MKNSMGFTIAVKPMGRDFWHQRLMDLWKPFVEVQHLDFVNGYVLIRVRLLYFRVKDLNPLDNIQRT